MARISKTSFLKGRQCAKRLWLHSRGLAEPAIDPDEVLRLREEEGDQVERLAEKLFPVRIRIGDPARSDEESDRRHEMELRVADTRERLREGCVLIQAHLQSDDLLAIVDVLEPRGAGWFVWEVKSSTHGPGKTSKALYDWDLAFQVHVAREAGLDVCGAGLLLLNADYVRGEGEVLPEELIVSLDRSVEVFALGDSVRLDLDRLLMVVNGTDEPGDLPGGRCKGSRGARTGDRPSSCGHLQSDGHCGKRLPMYWAGRLPSLSGAKERFVREAGYLPVDRLEGDDPDRNWTEKQRRVITAVKEGEPWLDPVQLRTALDEIRWPVAYVDFEFDPGMAIPRFPGTRPYDRLPFQWAMVVQEEPDGPLLPREPFLYIGQADPCAMFAESLLAALPPSGSIIAHHQSAETTVLEQLAKRLGDPLAPRLMALVGRFKDTQQIAESGYYHPDQQGSYSIKKLAPALVGKGYEGLEITNGMLAVAQWKKACDPETSDADRVVLEYALLQYCGRDAELMHEVLEELRRLSGWRTPKPNPRHTE